MRISTDGEIYIASTSYSVSILQRGEVEQRVDTGRHFSDQLWDLLDEDIVEVDESGLPNAIRLLVKGGQSILIWHDEIPEDNLLIVRQERSGDWIAIG